MTYVYYTYMCISETARSNGWRPQDSALFPPQRQLLDARFLESDDHWLICAATGSGKTRMAEWAIRAATNRGYRAAYIAPLRAIAEEKFAVWKTELSAVSIGLFTGRKTQDKNPPVPADESLLLFTPEKFASYLQAWRRHLRWLSALNVVVVDEFHLVGDSGRGATIECLINRLQRINPFVRVIGLSGTLSNHDEIASWLKAQVFTSNWRPIPLEHRIRHFKRAVDKPDLLLEESRDTLSQGGKVLAFVNSRRRAEQLAQFLKSHGFNAAFSHAGLDSHARTTTHNRMRSGATDVLVATSTVEMGVNFPARKVIIVDSYAFDGDAFGPITVQRYQQFAGRAGRPGLDSRGECVLFAPSWDGSLPMYVTATPERVKSSLFSTDNLLREILYEVAGRLSVSERHLETNFAQRTLWRHQGGQNNLRPFLQNLIVDGLLKESEKSGVTYLSSTPLGRVATQMLISPRTVILLATLLRDVPESSDFDLLFGACLSPETTPKLGFNFEEIDGLADTLLTVESTLLDEHVDHARQLWLGATDRALLSAVKCASILLRHTASESLEDLATQFDCYPADLITLKNNVIWVLESAQRVFNVLLDAEHPPVSNDDATPGDPRPARPPAPIERRCERMRLMLEYGIPHAALGLVVLPRVGPRRAQRLVQRNVINANQIAELNRDELAEILACGQKTAGLIIEAARDVSRPCELLESAAIGPARSTRFSAPSKFLAGWPADIDPYRLRRALELAVTHISAEVVHVSGGAEPHVVTIKEDPQRRRSYGCDCADFAKGTHKCKHILRAKLALRDDQDIRPLLDMLSDRTRKPLRHSLADFWMKVGRSYDAYNDRTFQWTAPQAETLVGAVTRKRR
jgi:helicase